jgi:peptidylprolyl isomerase
MGESMRKVATLSLLVLAAAAPAPKPQTASELVASAPAGAWRTIPADDLLVMQLRNGARIVIQLAPEFAPVHVANLQALAKAHWWDKASIYRVQDNYVVQWGKNESTDPLPAGVVAKPPAECAFCATALPLAEASTRSHGRPVIVLHKKADQTAWAA